MLLRFVIVLAYIITFPAHSYFFFFFLLYSIPDCSIPWPDLGFFKVYIYITYMRLLIKHTHLQKADLKWINSSHQIGIRHSRPSKQLSLSTNSIQSTKPSHIKSAMRYLQVVLVITTTTVTHMVKGLQCDSNCAACWKNGDERGADTKFSCNNSDCGSTCPEGYGWIHCAMSERCRYVEELSDFIKYCVPRLCISWLP